MIDPGILAEVDFGSFKAHLDLVIQYSLGYLPPDQLNLSMERIGPAFPLAVALHGALIKAANKLRESVRGSKEGWRNNPRLVRKFLKGLETISRLQGALAMASVIGHFILDQSMREQLEAAKIIPSSKKRKVIVKRSRKRLSRVESKSRGKKKEAVMHVLTRESQKRDSKGSGGVARSHIYAPRRLQEEKERSDFKKGGAKRK